MGFISHRDISQVQRWTKTIIWKNTFQLSRLTCASVPSPPTTCLLLLRNSSSKQSTTTVLRSPGFSRSFRWRSRCGKWTKNWGTCLHARGQIFPLSSPLWHAPGHISCHYVIILPSRIHLEGPYTTQSNRVIRLRHYQRHDVTLCFICVEFRGLASRWGGDVDGTRSLQQRVGGILRHGFELGGRALEFLAWMLDEERGDATVEDICDFIVKYTEP
jgi:hypothetical protein